MTNLNKLLFTVQFCLLAAGISFAQTATGQADVKTVTFRFVPGDDMFYIPWEGNGEQLTALYALVERYNREITSGRMPVYVDGYCASLPTAKENLHAAFIRANRVKSALITHKGLKESDFITKNYATPYTAPDGKSYRDMVVVMLRIPVKAQELKPEAGKEPEPELRPGSPRESHPVAEESQVVTEQTVEVVEFAAPVKPYGFAVRTNLLYDAFLLPTLGVEWRVNRDIGVKLDGSLAWWGDEHGKVQKMWLISPEVRWYLTRAKRFYVGLGGTVGKANIYGYPMGNMLQSLYTDDTGYQGDLYGAGLTVGYQLCLSRALSLDFNAGVGYTHFEYDSFGIVNRTRVHKAKDLSKDFWGPTQAGISLVWTIGGNKQ